MTCLTLFLYHVTECESRNFTKGEAKFVLAIAKFLNLLTCNQWVIEMPDCVEHFAREIKGKT